MSAVRTISSTRLFLPSVADDPRLAADRDAITRLDDHAPGQLTEAEPSP